MENNRLITFFGKTTFRGAQTRFGIRPDDKRRHVYIIGKTGMGKTELLKNMIVQDILRGNGVGFIDPHGEAAEEILDFIPEERIKDVVYFNPADLDNPIAFNIMEDVDANYRHLVAGGMMGVFKKIWPDVWSSRMEYILNNTILALLEIPGSTLLGINRLLSDAEWRESVVSRLQDPVVKAFWTKEFARYTQRYEIEATAAIQNKIGQFISTPIIRNIIGQAKSTIDMRKIMDEKKIFIMNLSKGRIGEDSSRLLGALLITKLQLAAMSRVDISEKERADFILYIDEFQNFSTESFATILSEARKYRLSLILAHQYIAQMDEQVRDAVFGNVGTMIVFRVGADDAEFLEREFSPEFYVQDLVNLPKQNIYVKLMIDGVTSRPFSAETLPPAERIGASHKEELTEFSRKKYGVSKSIVDAAIASETESSSAGGGDGVPLPPRQPVSQPTEIYEAQCVNCGKKVRVPFKPDNKRPIYCKACLKKPEQTETAFEKIQTISLEKTAKDFVPKEKIERKKEPVAEVKTAKKEEKKKEIDFDGLKDILKQAKNNPAAKKPAEEIPQRGVINPGETIKFD
ncbi:MAG: type IV secretion system DNA-binding domain-containing protein [Candidatus Pacebacteria bacterium]|nr:type IV secretion system DNA-binding domain-containing protein [Candidatus Paceibacterota bacterium]